MLSWLSARGAFEIAPRAAADFQCGGSEIRVIAAASGSCIMQFGGAAVTIAGDKALLLMGHSPDACIPSPDFSMTQIGVCAGAARTGLISPAGLYAACAEYRSLCAADEAYFTFHDLNANVLKARRRIELHMSAPSKERELLLSCELARLMLYAAAAYMNRIEKKPVGNRHLCAAIAFMHENYMFDISSLDIARAAGIHVSHLHRVFTAQTGRQPIQYLNDMRIEKAKLLLARTDFDLNIISKLCGMSTQQYFSRRFRQKAGITPLSYRREYAIACGNMPYAGAGSGIARPPLHLAKRSSQAAPAVRRCRVYRPSAPFGPPKRYRPLHKVGE